MIDAKDSKIIAYAKNKLISLGKDVSCAQETTLPNQGIRHLNVIGHNPFRSIHSTRRKIEYTSILGKH